MLMVVEGMYDHKYAINVHANNWVEKYVPRQTSFLANGEIGALVSVYKYSTELATKEKNVK